MKEGGGGGGDSFGALANPRRPPLSQNISSGKMNFNEEARNWGPFSGTQTFFVASDPPPPGGLPLSSGLVQFSRKLLRACFPPVFDARAGGDSFKGFLQGVQRRGYWAAVKGGLGGHGGYGGSGVPQHLLLWS